MCRNRNNHSNDRSPEVKFFRSLRSFFIFNVVMIILLITGNGISWFWKISAFWSIGLGIAYLRTFGLPGTEGLLSEEWETGMTEREVRRSRSSSNRSKPEWREKDLV